MCVVTLTLAALLTLATAVGGRADDSKAGGRAAQRLRAETIIDAAASRAPVLLSRYIAVDTTNPPGNEIVGARFLAEILDEAGIEARIFESEPGRGNLYARLKGTGSNRPIVLLSHIDVVPAQAARWKHPPLAGVISDGFVYGRGALDCKGVGITETLAVVALSELDEPLNRDVILLATAGEETGGSLGAGWMVENHLNLFGDAEFVLNEGGFIRRIVGKPLVYGLTAAEKGPCWFSVVASGDPGHGSRPSAQTAVTRLVEALGRLIAWERPLEVGPVVASYYAALAAFDPERGQQLRELSRSLEEPGFRRWFLADPAAAALVRDTLAPTVLVGSAKTNVVPAEARAEVDARLLPGHSCQRFLDDVRARIGSEHVRVEAASIAFAPSASPLGNALTQAVEELAAAEPEPAAVLPGLLTGFTDSHYFREVGIASYGFSPIVITEPQRRSVHAPDERVSASELEAAVRRLVDLLRIVGR